MVVASVQLVNQHIIEFLQWLGRKSNLFPSLCHLLKLITSSFNWGRPVSKDLGASEVDAKCTHGWYTPP